MPWPKDPFITDGGYKTPLPSQTCERQVWRVVARLYEYTTLTSLMRVNDAKGPTSPQSPFKSDSHGTAAPDKAAAVTQDSCKGSASSPAGGSPTSTTSRAEVVEPRSAFVAAAAVQNLPNDSAVSSNAATPLSALPTQHALTDSLGIVSTACVVAATATITVVGGAAAAIDGSATPPMTTVPPAAVSQSVSPHVVKEESSSWNGNFITNTDSGCTGGTTKCICATTPRALEPLKTLLLELAEHKFVMGAGVVDVAVKHPLSYLRFELVRMLLTYPYWDWSMCAPVAVAAGIGDVDVLKILMEVEELDPNTGFPLTVAVRQRQEEAVLPFLLSHHRIWPNYGGAFYVAVALGNTRAMHLLGDAAIVNVNRFANNEGTSALLYSLRQYLICRRWELQQARLEQPTSPPLPHVTKPYQSMSAPTCLSPAELNDANGGGKTATPLLAVQLRDDGSGGGAVGAAAEGSIKRSSLPVLSVRTPHGNPLFPSRSPEVVVERGKGGSREMQRDGWRVSSAEVTAPAAQGSDNATAANVANNTTVLNLTVNDTHITALPKDSKEHPLQTTRHWLEVLLYLLNHPAIEVNAGFYMTPLQICVLAGNTEVVSWLLQHPHLRPSRLPKATTALRNSYYLLQHHALSQPALQCVVATPIEMAAQLHHLDIFRHLVCDQRIQIPVELTIKLERSAADGTVIPFLTALAQHREEWEGWGWRWRRRCTLIATAALTTLAACFWTMVFLWRHTLHGALLVLAATYVGNVVLAVLLYMWEVHRQRYAVAAESAVTHGAASLFALVRHLCPSWTLLQQHVGVVVLLVCPGLLPLLDLLCAWCLFSVHRSRRLETGAGDGTALEAPSHSETPTTTTVAEATHGNIQHYRHRAPRPVSHYSARHPLTQERILGAERLSYTVSWGWSADVSNASEFSANSSVSETLLNTKTSGADNESFSRSRPTASAIHRQSAAATAAVAYCGHQNSHNNSGTQVTDALRNTSLTSLPPGGSRRQVSFATDSFTGGLASTSSMASPSMCTSRNRGLWVVPGRPSRYALTTEYHTPDLILRALAYTTFDTVLTLPRLVTCVVGVFMFMYMVFPSAAPTSSASVSSSSALLLAHHASSAAVADAIRHHSSFTLYYGIRSPAVTMAQPTAYDIVNTRSMYGDGAAAAAVMMTTSAPADLPAYTIGIGVVGFFGLVSSVVGGGALLAMMGSLRDVTVQAFFASPSDKADARVGTTGQAGNHQTASSDWRAVRHRAHEVLPDYTL